MTFYSTEKFGQRMIYTLETASWVAPFSQMEQQTAIELLEKGKVIYLPNLSFEFQDNEKTFLTPQLLGPGSKNVSFNPKTGRIKGVVCSEEKAQQVANLMARFTKNTRVLLENLIPHYRPSLKDGRTSYRPVEVAGRKSSSLKDDTRLHVDAFPATPNQGERILRVFSNVNPNQQARHWQLGESFEDVVNYFRSYLRKPFLGSRTVLSWLNITKSYRSLYDHYMLALHNHMKLNERYQKKVQKQDMLFPAGCSWIVMSDKVSHAALSGQYLLEQTFYLPVKGMLQPEHSPLRILERCLDKKLGPVDI